MNQLTLTMTSSTVVAGTAPLTVTAAVTNSAAVPARVVLGAFAPATPGAQDAKAWMQVDRPLRLIAPGTTEQYTVTIAPAPGAAPGGYGARFIAYDADRPPEEFSDQARHLEVEVPAITAPTAPAGIPWWVYVVAAVLVLVIGVVAFLVLRSGPAAPPAGPTPTPSPTATNPCQAPYVPRLARPGDLTCVTGLSATEAKLENDPELQKLRKDPTGPYGPETCVQGYVWREAFPGDVACVTVDTRTRTAWENQGNPNGTP